MPEIVAQPASRTAAPGQSAMLSISANGFPVPCYQWSFRGTNIAGATNASLMLTNISDGNFGTYQVIVTNMIGSVLSTPAELVLEQALQFTSQRMDADGFHLSIQGPAGTNYVVECSVNLSAWIPVCTNCTQTGLFGHVDTGAKTNVHLFYRVRPVP
jgi:hypothetical protein